MCDFAVLSPAPAESKVACDCSEPVWFELVVGNRISVLASDVNEARAYAHAYYQGLIPDSFCNGLIIDNNIIDVIQDRQ